MPTFHLFLERLGHGPIVCDGGMGTELYARGISYERLYWLLRIFVRKIGGLKESICYFD